MVVDLPWPAAPVTLRLILPAQPAVAPSAPLPAVPLVKRYGKNDVEWFGDALPHVDALRAGVANYFAAIHATPPKLDKAGKPLGIDAEQAAKILKTSKSDLLDKFISKAGKPFPAFLVMDKKGKITFDFPPREGDV